MTLNPGPSNDVVKIVKDGADGWCAGASSGDMKAYNDELAKGDVEFSKGTGHYDAAIGHYKNAWKAIKP